MEHQLLLQICILLLQLALVFCFIPLMKWVKHIMERLDTVQPPILPR
jgi:hypothetical protein